MLILTRAPSQKILIRTDDGIVITVMVTSINSGGTVSLGIDAPLSVDIAREELINEQNPRLHRQTRQGHD